MGFLPYSDSDVQAAADAVLDGGPLLPEEVTARLSESQRATYLHAVQRRTLALAVEAGRRWRRAAPPRTLPPPGLPLMEFVTPPDDASALG